MIRAEADRIGTAKHVPDPAKATCSRVHGSTGTSRTGDPQREKQDDELTFLLLFPRVFGGSKRVQTTLSYSAAENSSNKFSS